MIVSDRSHAEKLGISPWARLVSYGVAAVEPGLFGLGPIPAVRIALERAGWQIADIDRIEINEAFAAVSLAVSKELQIPDDIVNPEGGAIAHGHPIGATGAVDDPRQLTAPTIVERMAMALSCFLSLSASDNSGVSRPVGFP
jgi:acetyl-CoA C-acetyltransferase